MRPKSKDIGAQRRQPITDSCHFKSKANNNFSTVEDSLTDEDAARPKDQPKHARNASYKETSGAHLGSSGDVDSENQDGPSAADSLIKSLFYLRNEQTSRESYSNPFGRVLHKSMQYRCVDGSGPNKRIIVDLVDFIESKTSQSSKLASETIPQTFGSSPKTDQSAVDEAS